MPGLVKRQLSPRPTNTINSFKRFRGFGVAMRVGEAPQQENHMRSYFGRGDHAGIRFRAGARHGWPPEAKVRRQARHYQPQVDVGRTTKTSTFGWRFR